MPDRPLQPYHVNLAGGDDPWLVAKALRALNSAAAKANHSLQQQNDVMSGILAALAIEHGGELLIKREAVDVVGENDNIKILRSGDRSLVIVQYVPAERVN